MELIDIKIPGAVVVDGNEVLNLEMSFANLPVCLAEHRQKLKVRRGDHLKPNPGLDKITFSWFPDEEPPHIKIFMEKWAKLLLKPNKPKLSLVKE